MKIAILGGGNCYALNLARHLSDLGIEHFGIGRRPPKHPALWRVEHDYRYYALHLLREFGAVLDLLDRERPDIIVSFLAQGESAASFGYDSHLFYATNSTAMAHFAEEMRRRDYLRRFIQAGTSECYGSTELPAVETDPLRPTSPYAISKAAFDWHLQSMHRVHGFPMNILRPSNCFTPGQQLHRIIPRAICAALAGRKLPLHGGGAAEKSYMHATDLSRAIMAVIENGTPGKVYNCGPREPIRIRKLVLLCAVACGVKFTDLVEHAPERTGEDSRYWLSSEAIARDTGWMPTISLRDGIAEMTAWVRSFPELLTMDDTFRIAA